VICALGGARFTWSSAVPHGFQKDNHPAKSEVAERLKPILRFPKTMMSSCAIRVAKPGNHDKCRQAFIVAEQKIHCKGCQAHHTLFICCRFSRIQNAEFASGSSHDFSPSAQTLLTSAPSLVPSQVPPWSIGRQRFPRYFSTSNPRFEVRLSRVSGIAYASWRSPLSAYDVP